MCARAGVCVCVSVSVSVCVCYVCPRGCMCVYVYLCTRARLRVSVCACGPTQEGRLSEVLCKLQEAGTLYHAKYISALPKVMPRLV